MSKKRGFTLIELIITMTFITVIAMTITIAYLSGYTTFNRELASSTVQSDAQSILDSMMLDVKNAMLIETGYSGYTTSESTLILRVPAIDNNNRIIYSGTDMLYDIIIYDYTGTEIHKIVYANDASSRHSRDGIDTILDKNILLLSFEYDPDTLVTATIKSKADAGKTERAIMITGRARMRNHI
jgi:prepilin-type N-terminal cleavage/methylation domain-containing protein